MAGIQKYVAAAAVAVALIGAPTAAYGVSPGKAAPASGRSAHVTVGSVHATPLSLATIAPTARIVAPDEHVVEPGGAEFWLTAQGKHWTTLDNPDPQFASVVDGNIDLHTPGVSAHVEVTAEGHATLSGVYYGGRGTASRVTVRTTAGTLHGKLLELAGNPGWGVWYVSADLPAHSDDFGVRHIVVRDTEGEVYSRLDLN
ncbi:hypothetical protein [Streptomyces rhizosphaerihabitans]|uniref:hypothetical protein n=1 Tax=Streptomyces rhizosphaerihabitans TaxID=1266770 RepID=UPI0021BF1989|nr:hypothetical protein [Streptomyces rhizosphaerihabitans]MCT9008183.1 hypothetical protein [Streptomyces rhizosphaerihabitans]